MTKLPKKEPHSGQADGALRDSLPQSPTNFKPATAQAQEVDKTLKYRLLWLAPMPAPRKLVAMAMAQHSNPDGTNIFCSQGTLSAMCEIGPQQVSRHIDALIETGVFKLIRKANQRTPANYRLDLTVLLDLALKPVISKSSTGFNSGSNPPGNHRKKLQNDLQTRLLRQSAPALKPDYPLHPSGEEEEAGDGAGFARPPGIGETVWAELLVRRPDLSPGEMYRSAMAMLREKCSIAEVEGQMGWLAGQERKFKLLKAHNKTEPATRSPARGPVDYAEGF